MKVVTAYADCNGRLHKTEREALEADFIVMMKSLWLKMPAGHDVGDPEVIARSLTATPYNGARVAFTVAARFLEEHFISKPTAASGDR